ncbi:MAG: response regulator [Saprospiraceae bacterium]|nr:response regulator [Saprospiraceae bacterium]
MNNKIVVIEDSKSNFSEDFKCQKFEYSNQSKDEDIHRWLIANTDLLLHAERLIIPVRLGNEDAEHMGLYIGLHIRLTKELEAIRFLPILFVSKQTKEDILYNQINKLKEKSGLLLFTKGSYLVSASALDEYITKPLSNLDEQVLLETVIPSLNIQNTQDPGHQLANDWGAFRLAKFAGYTLNLEKPSSLYFKFKDSFTNNEIVPNANNTIGLFNESCKALLIDDNATSGWSETLKHILRSKIVNPGKSVSLDVITLFDDALNYSNYINYDVVFLDLRLLKEEDKSNQINSIDDFTGTKVLKVIKEINPGIQIIIFTASNKVWNIEKLLELGANGYYIKESPEYILSTRFSKDNYEEFIKTIQTCLLRKPLKQIYTLSQNIKSIITTLVKNKKIDKSFGKSVQQYIELANKIIDAARTENDYAMGYLVLFKCIELINDNYIAEDTPTNWIITNDSPLKQFRYNKGNNTAASVSPISFTNNLPSTFEKIAGITSQVLGFTNVDVLDLYHNVQRRNKFIHPDESGTLTPIQLGENKMIFTYEGYTKLIKSLDLIFSKLEMKLR